MTDNLRIGVMGCGNISTTYFKLSPCSRALKLPPAPTLTQKWQKRGHRNMAFPP